VRAAAALLDRREFAAALSAAPADPDAESARLRGLAQLGQQNYAGAAATLGAEFDAHPTDADVAFVLGWARRGAGDVPGALGAFRNAANLAPRLVPAHLAVASTYASVGQSALAIQALQAGLVHLPDSPELRDMLERLKK
jgi:tetratricopeptide (TPR) repeat protein